MKLRQALYDSDPRMPEVRLRLAYEDEGEISGALVASQPGWGRTTPAPLTNRPQPDSGAAARQSQRPRRASYRADEAGGYRTRLRHRRYRGEVHALSLATADSILQADPNSTRARKVTGVAQQTGHSDVPGDLKVRRRIFNAPPHSTRRSQRDPNNYKRRPGRSPAKSGRLRVTTILAICSKLCAPSYRRQLDLLETRADTEPKHRVPRRSCDIASILIDDGHTQEARADAQRGRPRRWPTAQIYNYAVLAVTVDPAHIGRRPMPLKANRARATIRYACMSWRWPTPSQSRHEDKGAGARRSSEVKPARHRRVGRWTVFASNWRVAGRHWPRMGHESTRMGEECFIFVSIRVHSWLNCLVFAWGVSRHATDHACQSPLLTRPPHVTRANCDAGLDRSSSGRTLVPENRPVSTSSNTLYLFREACAELLAVADVGVCPGLAASYTQTFTLVPGAPLWAPASPH